MNVGGFNAQLRRMGQDMMWSRASRCPCTSDMLSGSPSPSCKVCRARGYLWAAPVASRAGLSGMKVQREWAGFGQWESGDVVVSVGSDRPLYAAGEMDRILFSQSSESFDIVRARGSLTEFSVFIPVPTEGLSGTVSLPMLGMLAVRSKALPSLDLPVITFDRCFWLTTEKDRVIEGGIPVRAADGTLSWPNGGAPPDGTVYTLRGRKVPEYFMFTDFAQDRAHFGGQALPRRLVLRKWDLFPK